jgi:RNA polymerase sigma-70 factor (ECF subfamily)
LEVLVKKVKWGNKKAFSKLIKEVEIDGYKVAYTYLHNEADSKDALCCAVEKAYINIKNLKDNSMFKNWFLKIVINECKMIIRKNNIINVVPIESIINTKELNENNIDEKIDIEKALLVLDENYKELVIMKYYMGYSFKEIGELYNIPESTVKTRVYSALKKLKSELSIKEGCSC